MNKNVFICFVFALAVMCHGNADAIEAESVAMVTDLTGKAVVLEKSGKRTISILSEIKSGTKVQLDDKAHMVILYLKSSQEYEIQGSSIVQFNLTQPESIGGNKPSKRNALFGAGGDGVHIKPAMVAEAAIRMRGQEPTVKLLNLVDTLTLDTSPQFQWGPTNPDLKYKFIIMNEAGEILLKTLVAGNSYKLPISVVLDDKQVYTWKITSVPSVGMKYTAAGDFGVAPAELRKMAKNIRPLDGAQLSERVAFAIWLEQMNLMDEARKYWKAASAERPDDQQLAEKAAN